MRKKIAAANWKMNLNLTEALQLIQSLDSHLKQLKPNQQVILGVPFPLLIPVKNLISNYKHVDVAAQNCYSKLQGAYTGEVSPSLLKGLNINYVILGHSERRDYFNESNDFIKEKVALALQQQLTPIFCCGEALEIRNANNQNDFVKNQIKESLFHLNAQQISQVIIAYEPIWAIGTGKTATSLQAQEMHHFIRSVIAEKYGVACSENISILYGGSVKANNAFELFNQPDVDGGLVGGASLIATEFNTIIENLI
ncbi:MAG: triose-phosphate isomerase [Alphaproteobacteria bacterium]|nr:triose-phosphate isomerase [Alphaproteobacteria bacterium]